MSSPCAFKFGSFDPFAASFTPSTPSSSSHSDHYDSSFDASSNASTTASSLPSSPAFSADLGVGCDEEHYHSLSISLNELVAKLLKEKREHEREVEAWRVRCDTLEKECVRLVKVLEDKDKVEKEKERAQDKVAKKSNRHERRVSTPNSNKDDGPIPVIDPTKSMSKQSPPPCNAFYIVGHCDVPRCKYEHRYVLTPLEVEEMKRGAKFHLCRALQYSGKCEDEGCIYGHFCLRGPACSRKGCDFNDEQLGGVGGGKANNSITEQQHILPTMHMRLSASRHIHDHHTSSTTL